jgi:hypothetical protein
MVFSIVTACAFIESRWAAAQTVFHERRRADWTATWVRAPGGVSSGEFAHLMSRRQIMLRRELFLPPATDWHSKSLQKCAIQFNTNPEAESCLVTPVSRRIAGPPRYGAREQVYAPAVWPAGQMADWPDDELVGAPGLLARLVFHQVRPGRRSAADTGQRTSLHAKLGPVLVTTPDVESQCSLRSAQPAAVTPANSPVPVPAPMEILFAELASRRLRCLAIGKRP